MDRVRTACAPLVAKTLKRRVRTPSAGKYRRANLPGRESAGLKWRELAHKSTECRDKLLRFASARPEERRRMLITLIWLEIAVAVLFVWGAVVRANSHFRTPWLRYLFSIPGWFALVVFILVVAVREEVASEFNVARPLRNFFDVVVAGRERAALITAVALPLAALLVLGVGLCRRTEADGRRLPRARRWPWLALLGVPVLLVAAAVGEVRWAEHSLAQTFTAMKQASDRTYAEFQARRPAIDPNDDAAVTYLAAQALFDQDPRPVERPHARSTTIDWHGTDVEPLSAVERTAAQSLLAAGRAPHCRFRSNPLDPDEHTLADRIDNRAFDVLLRRAATAESDAEFRESVLALRDFLNHHLREPALRDPADLLFAEFHYLILIGEVAARAPERFSAFTPADLADVDGPMIIAPSADEALLIEAEHAAKFSQFLDPAFKVEDDDMFRLIGPRPTPHFGVEPAWYVREVQRLDRHAKLSVALAAYDARAAKLSAFIAATKQLGRPDWDVWTKNLARSNPGAQLINYDDELLRILMYDDALLRILMSRTIERYQVAAARRMAQTAIAVAQFGERHDRLPKSCDELVPGFLTAKPIDSLTGEPIGWENEQGDVLLFVGDSQEQSAHLTTLRNDPTFNVRSTSAMRVRRAP